VSDASVQKTKQSGFAWVIAHDDRPLWKGAGLAPGNADDMYSGRAEAFGLLAALLFLAHYIDSYRPTHFENTIFNCFCDNSGVITWITEKLDSSQVYPNNASANDHDIYTILISTTRRCAPANLHFLHVQGHQDTKANRPLTIVEQLNVECDRKAKTFVLNTKYSSTAYGNPDITEA